MRPFLIILLGLLIQSIIAQSTWQNKIDRSLMDKFDQYPYQEFIVVMHAQANTNTAKNIQGKNKKANHVFKVLKQHAQSSQSEILKIIEDHALRFNPFYIVNAILVEGDRNLMYELAKRLDVKLIADNPAIQFDQPILERNGLTKSVMGIEWGINRIGADFLWTKNIKGSGVVVGGQDTGYDWEHPALSQQYRGSMNDHNYHWHDAIYGQLSSDSFNSCGYQVNFPCDDGSHGTHTMGTMVGDDDSGNQIGVAPEAKWIGCRNMENGYGTPATYIECFEWFMAPTDSNDLNPDPSKAPHVIANSWGCPPSEGCNPSNFYLMQIVVENLKNSGVFIAVSAGNSGYSGCASVDDPAAIFEASFSVGASDYFDTLAGFSSRGWVEVDTSFRMKPNVTAPGVWIRSSIPDSAYTFYSGTSMAGPHVAGAVALLISASPGLAGNVDSLENILEMTADSIYTDRTDTCGNTTHDVFPNNMVGHGRINLIKALGVVRPDLVSTISLKHKQLKVFPNPFDQEIQFEIPFSELAVLKIHNALGQLVMNRIYHQNGIHRLNTNNLRSGIYYVHLTQGEKQYITTIIK